MRFTWHLDAGRSATQLVCDERCSLSDENIAGVFVRTPQLIGSGSWRPDDWTYMQTEAQAALLGWLHSLACPVVNRYPAHMWYRPQAPLLFWHALLWRCDLRVLESLVSNVEQEARSFAERLGSGVVYTPLTSEARYLVASQTDWIGVATMQGYAPVCLTQPHGTPYLACVVGEHVVWDNRPPEATMLEHGLRRFAACAGLSFVEIVLGPTPDGPRVVAVEPFPHFERFGLGSQRAIVSGLVELLANQHHAPGRVQVNSP
jgi:hypothetical protein